MAAESEIERKLVKGVRKAGGLALKFVSPGCAGVPDRLVLMPGGRASFAEVKAPGEKPRALQKAWMKKLETLGFFVRVVDNAEGIAELIRECQGFPAEAEVRGSQSRAGTETRPYGDPEGRGLSVEMTGRDADGLHQPETD